MIRSRQRISGPRLEILNIVPFSSAPPLSHWHAITLNGENLLISLAVTKDMILTVLGKVDV